MKSKKSKPTVSIQAQTSITLDGATRIDHCMNGWLYQNPGYGAALSDKDKIFIDKKANVSHVFFGKELSIHSKVSLKDLEKSITHAKKVFKKYRTSKRFPDACYVHIGNLSILITKGRR